MPKTKNGDIDIIELNRTSIQPSIANVAALKIFSSKAFQVKILKNIL